MGLFDHLNFINHHTILNVNLLLQLPFIDFMINNMTQTCPASGTAWQRMTDLVCVARKRKLEHD